jgi:hypothetical protein
MSPFEQFHLTFLAELDLVVIPKDAWGTPPAGDEDPSWDRKAAWLLWCELEGINPDGPPESKLTDDGY